MKAKHSKWISIDIDVLSDILKIPNLPACYVIYIRKKAYSQYRLIYIGASTKSIGGIGGRIYTRIKLKAKQKPNSRMFCPINQVETLYFDHKNAYACNLNTDGCTFRVKYKLSLKVGEELMRELRLIRRLKPICNGNTKKQKEKTIYPWYCCR